MKKLIILTISALINNAMSSQGFIGANPDTIFAVSRNGTFNQIRVAIGLDRPTEQLHTNQGVRFEGLTPSTDTNIVVWASGGKLFLRGITSIRGNSSSNNSWLLGGNTNVTGATDNRIGIMPGNIGGARDWEIFNNANTRRARYLSDGNYELGSTNTISTSQITSVNGISNTSTNDTTLFSYGTSNTSTTSKDCGLTGRGNIIESSQSFVAFGQGNRILNSNQGGVIGEDLQLINNHGSFMAGGHSMINNQNRSGYNISIGNHNHIVNSHLNSVFGHFNEMINGIHRSQLCHIHGNNSRIDTSNNAFSYGDHNTIEWGNEKFAFGNHLGIIGSAINPGANIFAFGSSITNDLDNSMKFGFNNNRTLTLTDRGVEIQMQPANPTYTPIHNLEVMAGSALGTVPEIQFQDLPVGSDTMDMVVINPSNFELYRIPNCCGSGGGITNTCITTGNVPRVDGSGSGNLECSQIHDAGIGLGVGIGTTSPRTFTGTGVAILGSPTVGTVSHLDVAGLTFTNTLVVSSDSRLKKDVKAIPNALEIVKSLNGVTYNWEKDKYKERNLDNIPQAGFLAQEVEKVYPVAVVKDNEGFYGMNYNAIIPLQNEAIKELDKKNSILESKISDYERKFELLEETIRQLCNSGCQGLKPNLLMPETDILYQSIPNPTDKDALINYYLSKDYTNASITVYTQEGKQMLSVKLAGLKGKGSVKIELGIFSAGTYLYSLIAEEVVIDTKRLQIIR